jgi:hypothetical protein
MRLTLSFESYSDAGKMIAFTGCDGDHRRFTRRDKLTAAARSHVKSAKTVR